VNSTISEGSRRKEEKERKPIKFLVQFVYLEAVVGSDNGKFVS
jgi:hypothetical protein